jgi:hypothetical protein
MVQDLVEARPLILILYGGLTKVIHFLLLLQTNALLVSCSSRWEFSCL